jgi:hypothetical protein
MTLPYLCPLLENTLFSRFSTTSCICFMSPKYLGYKNVYNLKILSLYFHDKPFSLETRNILRWLIVTFCYENVKIEKMTDTSEAHFTFFLKNYS